MLFYLFKSNIKPYLCMWIKTNHILKITLSLLLFPIKNYKLKSEAAYEIL